jgi:molybdopterin/thiamine biosynthesis adenylyltransferase
LLRGGELRLDDMNRQILMTDDWVGKPRVFKAQETLEAINPDVRVEAICEYVTPENVDDLVKNADIAIDCAHNFTERDLLICIHCTNFDFFNFPFNQVTSAKFHLYSSPY